MYITLQSFGSWFNACTLDRVEVSGTVWVTVTVRGRIEQNVGGLYKVGGGWNRAWGSGTESQVDNMVGVSGRTSC